MLTVLLAGHATPTPGCVALQGRYSNSEFALFRTKQKRARGTEYPGSLAAPEGVYAIRHPRADVRRFLRGVHLDASRRPGSRPSPSEAGHGARAGHAHSP